MKKNRLNIYILLLIFFCMSALAQKSKSKLEEERKKNINKITQVEKILSETKGKKRNTLGQLNALNQRIKVQQNLIQSILDEIDLLDSEINETNDLIEALTDDINKYKKEYSAMVYSSYKSQQGINRLMLIFSSESFNQFLMRLKYMEQYSQIRLKQAEQVVKIQEYLEIEVQSKKELINQQKKLLGIKVDENQNLDHLIKKQNNVVNNLKKQEDKLKSDLNQTKKTVAKLNNLIKNIINNEIEKSKLEVKVKIDANLKLSEKFEENKRKLPWPVKGFITQKFGKQNHPILKGIVINSTGVTIQTKTNEQVYSIYEGKATVAFIPLVGNTVILNHGNYFSVYAGLKDVKVKTNQQVKIGQVLGTILNNKDGVSELKFEIRKNAKALNPQLWLNNG